MTEHFVEPADDAVMNDAPAVSFSIGPDIRPEYILLDDACTCPSCSAAESDNARR